MLCPRTTLPALAFTTLLAVAALATPPRAAAQPRPPGVAPDAGVADAGAAPHALPAPQVLAAPQVVAAPPAGPVAPAPPAVLAAPAPQAVPAAPAEGVPAVGGTLSSEAAAVPAAAPPVAPRCVVIDAAPYGVDPVVGRYVSLTMRATAAELGYSVLTPEESVAAAQSVRMPYPPAPADLWRVTWAAQAARGGFARVWAYRGQYVVELTVASADGGGPFYARGSASAEELVATVARLTREALPPPGVSTAPQTQPGPGPQPPDGQLTPGGETPEQAVTPPRRRRRGKARRWVFSVQTDLAFGTSTDDFFFNALLGARIDYRLTPDIRLGAYLGYANLRGKDGRASNLLMLAQIEDRVRISAGTDIRVPLRLAIGYLPQNGPVVRLAAGLGFPISKRVEMTIDILAPTFWVIPNRTVVSLDLAVEVGYRF